MKPRIAVFTRPLDRGVSGSGMHLERIMSALVALPDARREFDFFYIHHKIKPYELYQSGEEVLVPRNPLAAAGQLRRFNFAIAHYHPLSVFSPMLLPGVRRCTTIHGKAEGDAGNGGVLVRKAHARWLIPAYARRMDLLFTVSKTTQEYVVKNHKVSAEKLRYTPNAVDSRFAVMAISDLKDIRHKYANDRKFVLVVSNFSERKNPWVSLRAFGRLARETDLQLVVVGNGWNQSTAVAEFIRTKNLGDRVTLTGFIPTEDIPKLMNLAECLVFPSLYEGFGMPNLEAMACGCPVITSDAFAIPEVVGEAAIILKDKHDDFELAGEIRRLSTDENLRNEMRRRGLIRVQSFSWEESARTLLAGYQEMVAMGPRG